MKNCCSETDLQFYSYTAQQITVALQYWASLFNSYSADLYIESSRHQLFENNSIQKRSSLSQHFYWKDFFSFLSFFRAFFAFVSFFFFPYILLPCLKQRPDAVLASNRLFCLEIPCHCCHTCCCVVPGSSSSQSSVMFCRWCNRCCGFISAFSCLQCWFDFCCCCENCCCNAARYSCTQLSVSFCC